MCRSRLACLLAACSFASLIRLALRPVSRVAPLSTVRLSVLPCVSPSRSVGHVRLVSSARPARSRLAARSALLTLPVSRVAGRGVPRLALISSCVPPLVSAYLLTVLCSARPRETVADVIASFLRFVAAVPPLSRIALSSRRSCRGTGRCRAVRLARMLFFLVGFLRSRVLFLVIMCYNLCRGDGDLRIGAFVPRSHMPHLLTRGRRTFVASYQYGVPHSC